MDKLEVLKSAEEKGGKQRRDAIQQLMIYARNLKCQVIAGGGLVGGINFRYGSIGYAIMDINTEGEVKLYAQPHPNKTAPEELSNKINAFLGDCEGLKLKTHPINCHGLLTQKVEDVPRTALIKFLEVALEGIKHTYYGM